MGENRGIPRNGDKQFTVQQGTTHVDHTGVCIKLWGGSFLRWCDISEDFVEDTSGYARIFYPLGYFTDGLASDGVEVVYK